MDTITRKRVPASYEAGNPRLCESRGIPQLSGQLPRQNWVNRFFSRHPSVQLKPSRLISASRKKAATPENLTKYYIGEDTIIEEKLTGTDRTYNVDETRLQEEKRTAASRRNDSYDSCREDAQRFYYVAYYSRVHSHLWPPTYAVRCVLRRRRSGTLVSRGYFPTRYSLQHIQASLTLKY